MRQRAGALILKDKKLLLISESNKDMCWTPGGGLEEGETFLEALTRELQEELSVELATAELFHEMLDNSGNGEDVKYYVVTINSEPNPEDSGTRLLYYSAENHQKNDINISERIYKLVYPKLIKAGLV
jgi:ADP-ribose pyrophosphatase YjhB (NUDIX family)